MGWEIIQYDWRSKYRQVTAQRGVHEGDMQVMYIGGACCVLRMLCSENERDH